MQNVYSSPARLAAQGGRFVRSLGTPLQGPWGSGGGPLGWSLGVPARLATHGERFVKSLGYSLEDPWRILGDSWGLS